MDDTAMDHYQMRIPAGTMVDGAVTELTLDQRGIITAEIRIPAPSPLIAPAGDVDHDRQPGT